MKIVIDIDPSTGMTSLKADESIERTKMVRVLLQLADSIVSSVGEAPTLIKPVSAFPLRSDKGPFH